MGFYAVQRAYYLGEMAAKDDSYVAQALASYSAAIDDDDTYAPLRANRAMLLAQSGDIQAALDEMETAQRLDPREPRYPLWMGALAECLGDREAATGAYLQALDLEPQWIESAYWDATPLRAQARSTYLNEVGLSDQSLEEIIKVSPLCWPQLAQKDSDLSKAE
jgi:tetratricopeptide (TPR) repeat protein